MSRSLCFVVGLMFIAAACLATAADETDPAAADDAQQIRGTWSVMKLEQVNHQSTPEEVQKLQSGGFKIKFTDNQMIFLVDDDDSRMGYRLDPSKKPRQMEFIENGQVVARGIYELAGDDLKMCLGRENLSGKSEAPRSFDLKQAKPGTFPTLWVLKRDKPAADEAK